MPQRKRVLILGASYGSLLATKLAMAGHDATLVCTAGTARLINADGTLVRMPVKGRSAPVEVRSGNLAGHIRAATPGDVDPAAFDLVALAMQEPQYGSPGVRQLMGRIARAQIPCMSIMNMPPLPYLARIPDIATSTLRTCYAEPGLWDDFDPALMTLCSPDPQAFRPAGEGSNVLQVRLATNFKAARFHSDEHTRMLRELEAGIDAARYEAGGPSVELPVRLKVYDSLFVPLAKWPMLMTGNYRCVGATGMRPIAEAVHADPEASQAVYDGVADLCLRLGADADDLVPFAKYAQAAQSLASPSSVARALAAGSFAIERVDKLVQTIAAAAGWRSAAIDQSVDTVEAWLSRNRALRAAS